MEKLEKILKKENIKYNESMKKHTTMKVGGNAKVLVEPESVEEIKQVIDFAKENNIDYYVIGKGSNLLVSDDGVDGIVIKISSKFSDIKVDGNTIYATSGASMPLVSITAKNNMLSGFEFACGIPGTIGGGVKMNAGAYGSEISNIVTEITYLDEEKMGVSFYVANTLMLYRTKNCVISYYDKHKDDYLTIPNEKERIGLGNIISYEFNINNNEEIAISGVGFINFTKACKVSIRTFECIELEIRKALI